MSQDLASQDLVGTWWVSTDPRDASRPSFSITQATDDYAWTDKGRRIKRSRLRPGGTGYRCISPDRDERGNLTTNEAT